MPGSLTTVRDLFRRLAADSPDITRTVRDGRRAVMGDEGTHSLFGGAANWIAKKIKGKETVNNFLYDHVQRPLKNLDEKGGRALAKHLNAPKLFRQVDVLPTTRKIDGRRALIEHETHSATAPISKASRIATPIAASLYAADKLRGTEEQDEDEEKMSQQADTEDEDKDALLKEASLNLSAAYRRVEAEKLAYAMVERGKVAPFRTYSEFQEKVASILEKDLAVVAQAIDMDPSLADLGKVASAQPGVGSGDDAAARFFHSLAPDA